MCFLSCCLQNLYFHPFHDKIWKGIILLEVPYKFFWKAKVVYLKSNTNIQVRDGTNLIEPHTNSIRLIPSEPILIRASVALLPDLPIWLMNHLMPWPKHCNIHKTQNENVIERTQDPWLNKQLKSSMIQAQRNKSRPNAMPPPLINHP